MIIYKDKSSKKFLLNLLFFNVSFGVFLLSLQLINGNIQRIQILYILILGFVLGSIFFLLLNWIGFFNKLHIAYYSLILLASALSLFEGFFSSELFFLLLILILLISIYIQTVINYKSYRIELTIWFIAFFLLIIGYATFQYIYSPDSYSLYELSKSIFSDFYRVNTIRQYSFFSDYGSSFPPVMPVLMACINKILDLRIYAGTFINFFISMITGIVLYKLSKKLFGNSYTGAISFLFLVSCPHYISEVLGGRTIPLSILLVLLLLFFCFDLPKVEAYKFIIIGILMGIGILTRTDFMPIAGIVLLTCIIIQRDRKLLNVLLMVACLVMVLVPWIYYSYTKFNVLLVSDNTRTALIAEMIRPSTYIAQAENPATLLNNPLLWLKYFFSINLKLTLNSLIKYWIKYGFAFIAIITIMSVSICLKGTRNILKKNRKINIVIIIIIIGFIIQFAGVTATGFNEQRYYIPITLLLLFLIVGKCMAYGTKASSWFFKTYSIFIVAVLVILAVFSLLEMLGVSKKNLISKPKHNIEMIIEKIDLFSNPINKEKLEISEEMLNIKILLENDIQTPRVFFITRNLSTGSLWEFGALTGIYTAYISQPTEERILEVLQEHIKPTHIYCLEEDKERLNIIGKKYNIKYFNEDYNLYKIWLR